MTILKQELVATNKNTLTTYHAARSNPKEGDIDWGIASAVIIRSLYKKQLSKALKAKINKEAVDPCEEAMSVFRKKVLADFENNLDTPEFAEIIDKMYFLNNELFKVSPEFQVLKLASLSKSSSRNRLPNMFLSMLPGFDKKPADCPSNFIEQLIIRSFDSEQLISSFSNIREVSNVNAESPYLPFLTDLFKKDLEFIVSHPRYLLDHITELLKLYSYLYTTQLSLNLTAYKTEPSVKPMHFMLENEKASKDRVQLTREGHKSAAKYFRLIFPYLSANESIQEPDDHQRFQPLWKVYDKIDSSDTSRLRAYVEDYAEARDEPTRDLDRSNASGRAWLSELLYIAERQFDQGKGRSAANMRFVRNIESDFCSDFAKSRGATGKVAVLNQDYLTLLTNISIGDSPKLRLSDLIQEFKARGVFLDKQSQQALIKFYERMGNVERMSDSGDAVYVRKTF